MSVRQTVTPMIVGLLLGFVGAATADGPTLELTAAAARARLGDRVEVLASARGGDGWLWGEPTVAVEPDGPWALVDGPTAVAGARPPVWEMVLVPLALGEQELPVVTVAARPTDGEVVTVAAAGPVVVTVESVLIEDEGDPAPEPLRDPIGVHGFPWEWVLPAAGALLPLLAGAAWWWRGRSRAAAPTRPRRPPLAELEALAAELEVRIGREPADGICDRVAAGLRRYLERRTGEPAEEMTSFELRLLARRRGWPELAQRLMQGVLGLADGVRFGRRPASDDELRRALADAVGAARAVDGFVTAAEAAPEIAEGGR